MHLCDFDRFRNDKRVRFKEEIVDEKEVIIVHYMIKTDNFWNLPFATETRGHVFDKNTGELISLGFEKFFNVNETEETQFHNLDFTDSRKYTKNDGSMIQVVSINNKLFTKTKKSFYSDVAKCAQKFLNKHNNLQKFCEYIISKNYSPLFEYWNQDYKIVLDYDSEQMVLLAARHNETLEYLDYKELQKLAYNFGIDIINTWDLSIDYIQEELKTIVNFEGYVIELNNGKRVKIKSDWYVRNHKLFTDIRERDIVEMILDETIDDIKSIVIEAGLDWSKISDIENEVFGRILDIENEVFSIVENCKELTKKEIATKYKKHKYFSLIMGEINYGEGEYAEYYKKNFLKSHTLKSIYIIQILERSHDYYQRS